MCIFRIRFTNEEEREDVDAFLQHNNLSYTDVSLVNYCTNNNTCIIVDLKFDIIHVHVYNI